MPYVPMEERKQLEADLKKAKTDGQINYLFTIAYLKAFIANPSYAAIALIRKASINPSKIQEVLALENFLTVLGFSALDRQVARDLAFAEFYDRVGAGYETFAREKNGDLREYDEAFEAIRKKFLEAK